LHQSNKKVFSLLLMSLLSLRSAGSWLMSLLFAFVFLFLQNQAFAQTQVTNTAVISVPAGVTNTGVGCTTGTCTAADVDTITPSRPTVSKTFTPSTISAGQTSLLVITFTNTHQLTSATFTSAFTDAYPTGIVNATTPAATSTCANISVITAPAGAGALTLPVGTVISPGGSCSVSVVVTGTQTAPNSIPAGSLTTSLGSNPTAVTATLTVNPSADLRISKTASAGSVSAGGTFSYTITVFNAGSSTAANVNVTDLISASLTFVSATGNGLAPANSGNQVTATAVILAANTTATLTIVVQAGAGISGQVGNSASVTSTTADPNTTNNASTVTVTVVLADVSTTVSLPANGTPGSNVTATVVYQNAATATGTITFTPIIGGIAQPPVSLAPGASTTLFVTTPVTTSGATVTATFNGNNIPDANPNNNLATATLSPLVSSTSDISVTLAVPTSTSPGQVITATVIVTNNGPSTAATVSAVVTLPNGSTVSVVLGTTSLGVNQATSGAVTYTVPLNATQAQIFTATVATRTTETTLVNNTTSRAVPLSTATVADISVTLAVPTSTSPGQVITATVIVTNNGPSTAATVSAVVTLPNGSTVSVVLGTTSLGVNQATSGAVTYTVPLNATQAQIFTATVATGTSQTNTVNDQTSRAIPLVTSTLADISVTLIVPASASPGSTIIGTVNVQNVGLSTASSVTAVVTLPGGSTRAITLTTTALVAGGVTSGTFSYVIPASSSGLLPFIAAVRTSSTETQIINNTTTARIAVNVIVVNNNADISVTMALPSSITAGSTITGSVVVINNGPNPATNVMAVVTLPNGTTVNVTLNNTNLASGESTGGSFTYFVPSSSTGNLPFSTSVKTDTPETTLVNNVTSGIVSVVAVADISVTLSLPSAVTVGTTVTGTVNVINNGPSTANNVAAIVTLPNGNTISVTLGTTTLSGANGSTFGTFTYFIAGNTEGTLNFVATVDTSTQETTKTNNVTRIGIAVILQSDISVTLAVPSEATPGSVITGTVTVVNNGPSTATNVTTIVTLPNGSTVSVALDNTILNGNKGEARGNFTYAVPPSQSNTMNWTATAATTTPETNTVNNIATGITGVIKVFNASVSGRVWLDSNGNQIYNLGVDTDLSGWKVELLLGNVVVGTATTGVNGTYTIANQLPGDGYSIRFRNPSGQVIVATPFNQAQTTARGNPSTGTTINQITNSVVVSGAIDRVTLYVGDNVVEQNLPVDPSGVVYDSVTRQPVKGAIVVLIGPDGQPVADDNLIGTSATITTDESGIYQYLLKPTAPVGVYQLRITPPAGYSNSTAVLGGVALPGIAPNTNASRGSVIGGVYTPPTTAAFVNVQPNANAPQVQVTGASGVGELGTQYFLQFSLTPGGANPTAGVLHNHVPLDPLAPGALLISKVGDKSVAEIADSVRYTIRVRNTSNAPIPNVEVEDLLPAGFRYIPGTSRLNNVTLTDPLGGVGREMLFNLSAASGAIPANTTWELTYFIRVGVGAQQGDGINRATALFRSAGGSKVRSNTAQYRVRIQGGVFSNDGCIIGKVYVDCDGNHIQNNESGSRELGIPGVRLVMLDGTQITTDNEGKYSICGVKAQTHVIKVDRTSLPKGSRLLPSSNRNAGVGDSIFVDLKGGELFRADFIEGSCSPDVLDQVKARRALGNVLVPEKEVTPDLTMKDTKQAPLPILPSLRPEFNPAQTNSGGKTP
jgi:large repetitive protein